jgi:hypothetical protein
MRAPVLAVGDGELGFWGALREVFPEAKEQRCWVHKIARVLDALPKGLQPKAKAALHEIMNAENKDAAELAMDRFQEAYEAKYPKATEKLVKDREVLLTHFEYPAEHWIHLRTTNAIESTFATVRLRTRKTEGAGSRSAGLAMAYKLLDAAQARWRAVNAPHLVALVRAGATFVDGVKVEREDQRSAAVPPRPLSKFDRNRIRDGVPSNSDQAVTLPTKGAGDPQIPPGTAGSPTPVLPISRLTGSLALPATGPTVRCPRHTSATRWPYLA